MALPTSELIRACADGEAAAWQEFIRRFNRIIAITAYRAARRWGGDALAVVDDLTQETYLKLCADDARVLREFDSLRQDAIYAFLKVVTSNVANDYFKRLRAGKRGGSRSDEPLDDAERNGSAVGPSGEVNVERAVLLKEVDACLCTVAPEHTHERCDGRRKAVVWSNERNTALAQDKVSKTAYDVRECLLLETRQRSMNRFFEGFVMLAYGASAALGQQTDIPRFDAFASSSFLSIPKLSLLEHGVNAEFGTNVRTWLAFGGDFSVFSGQSSLTLPDLAPTQLAKLASFGTLLPPGFALSIPYNGSTYTVSAGPQLTFRKWKQITVFVRPGLGAFHQTVTAKAGGPPLTNIVTALVGPSERVSDTVAFYGFGGGFDVNTCRRVAIRFATDFAHVTPFKELLSGGDNIVRFSVGPTLRWGRNIAATH